MREFAIAAIPADGIGPEVVDATVKVLEATGLSLSWDVFDKTGTLTHRERGEIKFIGEPLDAHEKQMLREAEFQTEDQIHHQDGVVHIAQSLIPF